MARTGASGRDIIDESIQSQDIKDGTIQVSDLDVTSVKAGTLPFDDSNVNFSASFIQDAIEQVASLGGEAEYFDGYDSSGGLVLSSTWTPIPLNIERKKTITFLHDINTNNSEITIDDDITIMVFASVSIDTISGTSRSQGQMKISLHDGSTWSDISGTIKSVYLRQINYDGAVTAIAVLSMLQGQKLRIEARRELGTNVLHSAIGSSLSIVKFKGEKGNNGSIGLTGVDGLDGVDGADGLNATVEQLINAVKFIGGDGSIAILNDGLDGEIPVITEVPEGALVSTTLSSVLVKHGEPTPKKEFYFTNINNISCEHNFNGLVTVDVFTTTFSQGDSRLCGTFLSGSTTTGTDFQNSGWTKLTDNQYTVNNILDNSIEITLASNLSGVIIVRN